MSLQTQYDEQIERVFILREALVSTNNINADKRMSIRMKLYREKEKAMKLDEKIHEEVFPLFKAEFLVRKQKGIKKYLNA